MRLWIVNHYAIPDSFAGGTRHFHLGRELVRKGHAVTIFASSFDHITRHQRFCLNGNAVENRTYDGVEFFWVKTPSYTGNTSARVSNMLAFTRAAKRAFRQLPLPRPDVILGSSPHLFAAWAALTAAQEKNVPFVFEIRDIWPQSLVELAGLAPWHPGIIALRLLEKRIYRRARHIVTLMPEAHQHIARSVPLAPPITWIPNGVVIDDFPPPVFRNDDGPFEVIYAGAHGVNNGLDTILEAAAILQSRASCARVIRFRFIGDGPEKARLVAKAQALALANITFLDPIPKSGIPAALQQADCFVVTACRAPLYRYGLSFNKLFDFLAVGRPIVFAGEAEQNPVSLSGAGLIVPPEDPRALAEGIERMSRLPAETRMAMGNAGRQYVEKNHNTRLLADRLLEVLQSVTGFRSDQPLFHRS